MGEEEMRRAVETGGGKPVRCERCGGLVKPDIVFFGEGLPERFFELAVKDLPKCDLLIVVGTSLKVHPFASLVERVPRTCPRLLINREAVGEATGWGDRGFSFKEGSRDRFFQGDADAGAKELARGLGWQDELNNMVETQQSELRIKWGLEESSLEPSAQTAVKPEDTIDKLAKELGQAGL
ncbi:hypothetical protein FFLO_06462 [Filobasidium floriforme]|uniref:Deacetylase sirtuin-type domain-containing protein n=1 Tax=Filobasidium floriforme TaxID=5210 RepID=A0A8K0JG73_9TREE|nr:hypothetical protein FFLO_06462 [Filobasidium floriforme]